MSDRVIYVLFLVLLAGMPFLQFSDRPMSRNPVWIVTFLLCAVWLLFYVLERVRIPKRSSAIWPLLLLVVVLIWIFIQAGWNGSTWLSYDRHATRVQGVRFVFLLGVLALTLSLIHSRKRLAILAWTLLLSGTTQATIAILLGSTTVFANYNHLAGYLEMSLAMGIGLMISQLNPNQSVGWREVARRWIRTLLGPKARVRIMLLIMVAGLIVSRSRMGNVAFFASMAIAGGIGLLMFKRYNRSVVVLFASLLVVDFFLMGAIFGIDKLQRRFEQIDYRQDERAVVRASSRSLVRDNMLTGVGAGAYYAVLPLYRDDRNTQFYVHAHNDYFEVQSEFGLIGTVPLAMLILYSLYLAIQVQRKRRDPLMKSMGFSATMGITAIMIHSTTDFNLQITANAATFMVILALPFVAMTVDRRGNSYP